MNEKLQSYLSSKQSVKDQQLNEILIEEGLYEREYSNQAVPSAAYPFRGWDAEEQRERYYRKTPVKLTDEEKAAFLAAYTPKEPVEEEPFEDDLPEEQPANGVATALTAIAVVVFITGFIAGLVLGSAGDSFTFSAALAYWAGALISGVFILGFAEIIKLLTAIREK